MHDMLHLVNVLYAISLVGDDVANWGEMLVCTGVNPSTSSCWESDANMSAQVHSNASKGHLAWAEHVDL